MAMARLAAAAMVSVVANTISPGSGAGNKPIFGIEEATRLAAASTVSAMAKPKSRCTSGSLPRPLLPLPPLPPAPPAPLPLAPAAPLPPSPPSPPLSAATLELALAPSPPALETVPLNKPFKEPPKEVGGIEVKPSTAPSLAASTTISPVLALTETMVPFKLGLENNCPADRPSVPPATVMVVVSPLTWELNTAETVKPSTRSSVRLLES